MTKANWANNAMKRKTMSGLENVTKNAVQMLYHIVPFCWPDLWAFFIGSLRHVYKPKPSNSTLPIICR